MKAKSILLGLVFFVIGMVVSFGIESNNRHHIFNQQAQVRKSMVIEVGAPLSVKQLKREGFIKTTVIEVGAPLTVNQLKNEGFII